MWFILFFCLAAVDNTYIRVFHATYPIMEHLGVIGLTVTLCLIGTGLSVKMLREVGFDRFCWESFSGVCCREVARADSWRVDSSVPPGRICPAAEDRAHGRLDMVNSKNVGSFRFSANQTHGDCTRPVPAGFRVCDGSKTDLLRPFPRARKRGSRGEGLPRRHAGPAGATHSCTCFRPACCLARSLRSIRGFQPAERRSAADARDRRLSLSSFCLALLFSSSFLTASSFFSLNVSANLPCVPPAVVSRVRVFVCIVTFSEDSRHVFPVSG